MKVVRKWVPQLGSTIYYIPYLSVEYDTMFCNYGVGLDVFWNMGVHKLFLVRTQTSQYSEDIAHGLIFTKVKTLLSWFLIDTFHMKNFVRGENCDRRRALWISSKVCREIFVCCINQIRFLLLVIQQKNFFIQTFELWHQSV